MSKPQQDVFIFPEFDQLWRPNAAEMLAIFDLMLDNPSSEDKVFIRTSNFSTVYYRSLKHSFFELNPPIKFFSNNLIYPSVHNTDIQADCVKKTNEYYYKYIDFDYNRIYVSKTSNAVHVFSHQQLNESLNNLDDQERGDYEIISSYVPSDLNEWITQRAGIPRAADVICFHNMDMVLGFNNYFHASQEFLDDLNIHLTRFAISIGSTYYWIEDCMDGHEAECLFQGYLWNKVKDIEKITGKKFTIKSNIYE